MARKLTRRRVSERCWMFLCIALAAACSPASPVIPSMFATEPSPAADPAAALLKPAAAPVAAAAPPAPVIVYGAPDKGFPVNTVLSLDQPIEAGDYAWNGEGAPEGPTTIVVDLAVQRLYVYRAGVEIGRSSLIYGADEKPTPTGTFPILQKNADHVSNIYDGAPMPYMLRLTWDGVAIHGSEVDEEYATHGCVGIPEPFAEILFAEAKLGDRVLVTHGWMTEVYEAEGAEIPVPVTV